MSSVTNKATSKDADEIDLGRLIGEFIDHRKLIISVTSLFTLVALIYAIFATPIYQADALIQVEQKQANAILSNLSQMLPDSQPQSAPEIALIRSRMILGKTVDDLNLQARVKQKYFPLLGRGFARLSGDKPGSLSISRLYIPENDNDTPEIILTVKERNSFSISVGDFIINGKVGELLDERGISLKVDEISAKPGTEFSIVYVSRLKAITDLQDDIAVADQGKDTGMLTLSLTGDNPVLIERILNSISENYLAQNIARQAAQDAKSLEFLSKQLPEVRSDLDQAEDKLNQYRRKSDSVDLSLEAKAVLDQIVNVDNQLNELTFRESEISQLYTKEHPTYKALMEKRKTLQDEKSKLNKRVSAMPETQQEILRLSRDVESGRAVYMQLLNRQQELNIAKSSAIGNVRIIDNAVTQPKPIKPKKILIVLIGIILGVMTSAGVVLLRVFLRRGIETPEQLEELGINVYASIPIAETFSKSVVQKKGWSKKSAEEIQGFLAVDNPADLAIEAIRGLRTSLHFAMMEARNNVLMISGASPNAGKTFVSSNLAAVISQTGKKVLFIDTDMRKGYTHKLFNENNTNGLSDILSGKVEINRALKKVVSGDFDFISRGMAPPNPAELLMHRRFGELLNWASENYDIVVLDTPPILAVTDAAIIGNYVGTTLLVARFELNTAKEIEVSVKRFEQAGVTVKGCILNGVVKKASSYYGYGYSHYGYSYTDKQ
ncbi:TPA: polysaccharide biosynthesis tyrosine autokinase [Klebsiella quasipneumoniae subsp. similipneumoniae]|uniref:polysaccharide biosynthesis tyrosine autokinase n=1 Tax=Klebsiella quasipneumoniae TaxID=1463165 RepID=UPI00080900B5|nr:polysaccharide biosynthesis tyrosine autokinase [Klebsiella quasipneumoniae]EKV8772904.1 polysaccharide biosynthesis tyrosine autokinase [Klebsiella variicola]NHJ95012.1 polysaccharide biosynthesis tyrosine autokinase [Klebsiella quasipneumoniae subsp. similipneumoniae]HCI6848415.1 polysaccharide biosynthesis tyrosine autokinase [Klebsiella quasipneumoniae subsp. quasipneumoniae]EKW0517395.1 polysaccharide biosynthesis tyrosine autokinase [Klebsiella variicola]MDG0504179.1 polysaccharide bi